jgi:hypothetical protein
MSVHLFIKKPLEEAEEKHGEAFITACSGRAGQARIDTLYGMLYPPRFLFEDPYTHLGILWTWELSWHKDIKPALVDFCMTEGVLPLDGVKQLHAHLDLYHPKPDAKRLAAWGVLMADPDGKVKEGIPLTQKYMKLWQRYYGHRRKEFKKFIECAIQHESGIDVCLNH